MTDKLIPSYGISYADLRELWTGSRERVECSHLSLIQDVKPSSTDGCQECLDKGDAWPLLRICLICGYVGCCDQTENQHMLKHVRKTGHVLIQSFEPDEDWIWCYEDKALFPPPQNE